MYKTILVAIDGSYYSREALPAAIEIGKKFDAQLFIVHVAEHDRGRAAAYTLDSPAEQTRRVAEAVKQAHDAGATAKGELIDRAAGHVAAAIAEEAVKHDADLIVMGSRGLSDAQGVFLGSVTHRVIQLAEAPVLITRPHKAAAKKVEPELAAANS